MAPVRISLASISVLCFTKIKLTPNHGGATAIGKFVPSRNKSLCVHCAGRVRGLPSVVVTYSVQFFTPCIRGFHIPTCLQADRNQLYMSHKMWETNRASGANCFASSPLKRSIEKEIFLKKKNSLYCSNSSKIFNLQFVDSYLVVN